MAVSGFTYPCLKYETEAKKLLADVENATTLAKIREIFKEFAEIYTVLPALWKIWIMYVKKRQICKIINQNI